LVVEDEAATTLAVTLSEELDAPIVVRLQPDGVSSGRVAIEARPFSRGTVVLDHVGRAEFLQTVDVKVGDGAYLSLVSLQDWDDGAVHLGWHTTCIGRDACFRAAHVTLGGDVVRINQRVRYAGPGGDAELLGLFFADDGQHLEHRLLVDHAVPRCRSRVTYKGALQGAEAHSVWVGDVLIRPEAEQTDTYEI